MAWSALEKKYPELGIQSKILAAKNIFPVRTVSSSFTEAAAPGRKGRNLLLFLLGTAHVDRVTDDGHVVGVHLGATTLERGQEASVLRRGSRVALEIGAIGLEGKAGEVQLESLPSRTNTVSTGILPFLTSVTPLMSVTVSL